MSADIEPILRFAAGVPASPDDWLMPPTAISPLGEGVHVWRIELSCACASRLAELEEMLSGDERARASRFHFDVHRRRFVIGRAALRIILGRYAARDPRSLAFTYGRWGKPQIADGPHFNLAHAEDLALLAVRQVGPVGIDVECIARPFDYAGIAAAHFSPQEALAVAAAPADQRAEMFFTSWTRREAVLKSLGVGISGLRRGEGPGHPEWAGDVESFRPALGFVAAVAIPYTR